MAPGATIFLSAAETSGDEHAARLIDALRRRLPDARFIGAAGPRMAEAGCEVLVDLTGKASMFGGPILRVGSYVGSVLRLCRAVRCLRPDLLIPVDSPALNWHLARAARKVGTPVFYYIAPQVWAWAPWRVRKLSRLTDQVGCILPFEQRYLWDRGVHAAYVGHPLFDHLPPRPEKLPDLADAWMHGRWRVAMIPGSRKAEIKGHMKALLVVDGMIRRRWPQARCTFPAANERDERLIRQLAKGAEIDVTVGRTREVLAQSHFAVTKSGTVTLELAHFGVPMVIFHRTSRLVGLLRHLLGRWGVSTASFSLVNILAGRKIVPELMPWHGNIRKLTAAVKEVMDDYGYLFEVRRQLIALTDPLAVPPPASASDRAAELAVSLIDRR
ncbi:MAG: lipid-A-disaccharide synthase [Phycisphaerae bacterium]|nr:lipid-A-disaccharide synthase [Phycisphaerae bacterium]